MSADKEIATLAADIADGGKPDMQLARHLHDLGYRLKPYVEMPLAMTWRRGRTFMEHMHDIALWSDDGPVLVTRRDLRALYSMAEALKAAKSHLELFPAFAPGLSHSTPAIIDMINAAFALSELTSVHGDKP